jgi:TRAP-type C4-dicarboxylate transport system permease small subunit
MKKAIIVNAIILTILLNATPVFAEATTAAGVGQIQTFIQSVIQVLVTLAGLVSVGFFVWGGFGYITSSGNPESLDRSKKTIMYSAIGLTVVLASFVLANIVTQLATAAFGAAH